VLPGHRVRAGQARDGRGDRSPTLRRAVWDFDFTPNRTGTRIEWNIELVPKARYVFLEFVLRLNRPQLVRDMRWFREALDEEFPA
jgi:hypothetical protein